MSAPLQHRYQAPPAEVFLASWLLPITSRAAIGSKRWAAGMALPYRAVQRVSGQLTADADYPLMWVHTFGADYTSAAREAARTDSRLMVLVDYPGFDTVLPDGRVAHCEWIEITEAAHEQPYAAETAVTRFVSECRLGLSLVTA